MADLKRPASYPDIVALPEWKVGEIVHGELVVSPRPAPRHAQASSVLGVKIGNRYQHGGETGGWWVLDEPELHLGDDVLVPDLAGWRLERMPGLPEGAYFPLAPDWICEVLSPSTETLDRAQKLPVYAAAGVRHAWLVNPLTRTLEVLRLEHGQWLLVSTYANDAVVRAEPFEAAEIDLLLLWVEVRPK